MSALLTGIAGLFLVAAGMGIGWQVGAARQSRANAAAVAPRRSSALRDLCTRALRICGEQVASSTRTANEAVSRLTVIFSSTVQRLEASIRATRSTVADLRGDAGIAEAISRGESDLQVIVQVLQSMHRSREAMLAEVASYSRDLKDLAADVQRISMQVRLLSFNTAVEAAREARSGAGFGVVAREMRDLASMADETAARMVKKVETIDEALATVFADEGRAVHEEVGSIARAEAVIHEVTGGFRRVAQELSTTLDVMENEAEAVHREVSDALFALQFQDRVSQIQAHVAANLEALAQLLDRADAQPVDREEWLRRMALDFIADGPAAAAPDSSVTFF